LPNHLQEFEVADVGFCIEGLGLFFKNCDQGECCFLQEMDVLIGVDEDEVDHEVVALGSVA